jgi:hypothetical protein
MNLVPYTGTGINNKTGYYKGIELTLTQELFKMANGF